MLRLALVTLLVGGTAFARDRRPPHPPPPPHPPCDPAVSADCKGTPKVTNIDITKPLGIDGKLRTPSMLYFLERATEELERAALEKKSFVPKLVQSVDEEAL
jgi:hypothetical protein